MILNTKLSHDAEYLGDVQENRVGIDKSNIDFITTLLTSNLYSKPLESFLRETVANAYDSHVEAGTNEHILILIQDTNQYKTYRISVRDYGTGVSPERFDKIYKNIGSSTKRQSNDFIGMFGIGRFSCLSCADVAQITSYYNGKKYSYVMYKNGGG
jgi:DNA topoisomerase VI subunit B